MSKVQEFKEFINEGYTFKGDYITLGGAMLDGQSISDAHVKVPLKTLNRHGLISGATGTGKTKSLQVLAEQLSKKGIPSLSMDVKGDLSGIGASGSLNDFISKRHEAINLPYEPMPLPVELMTISDGTGVRLKATITEFGPVLLSKILDLNETQSSVISLLFVFCDSQQLPLIDLKDLRKVLQYVINDGKEIIKEEYGSVSSATVNTIMRKVIELEQQGADGFFGERSFEPQDLLRKDENGNGIISILRLMDIQNRPKLFSTFMLSLLAEIYTSFPEQGDSDKPKLCIFIDEAHLVFKEASKALLDQIEVIVKLVRSKGIGIFFCTQNPTDIPDDVLSQLGLKVQHALRAFTEKDRKTIRKVSENYPITEWYETDELITQLGIGEALITALNEKGIPTPLVATVCRAPLTRMGVLTPEEVKILVENSSLTAKYNVDIDRNSAYEILTGKLKTASEIEHQEKVITDHEKADELIADKEAKIRAEELKKEKLEETKRIKAAAKKKSARKRARLWDNVTDGITKGATTSRGGGLIGKLTRGLLGVLGLK